MQAGSSDFSDCVLVLRQLAFAEDQQWQLAHFSKVLHPQFQSQYSSFAWEAYHNDSWDLKRWPLTVSQGTFWSQTSF